MTQLTVFIRAYFLDYGSKASFSLMFSPGMKGGTDCTAERNNERQEETNEQWGALRVAGGSLLRALQCLDGSHNKKQLNS
jgi:hypothetical protein